MAIIDLVARAVAGPAGRVVEAPVRDLVEDALRQHDIARPEDLRSVRQEVGRLTSELSTLAERIETLTNAVGNLQSQTEAAQQVAEDAQAAQVASDAKVAALQKELAGLKAAPPAATPKKAAPKKATAKKATPKKAASKKAVDDDDAKRGRRSLAHLGCKVSGCEQPHRSKGFCSKHYQGWRRGRLEGYVGPEGMVEHKGIALRVDPKLAGEAIKVSGKNDSLKATVKRKAVDVSVVG